MRKISRLLAAPIAALLIAAGITYMSPQHVRDAIAQGFTLPDGSIVGGHLAVQGPLPTLVGCTITAGSTDTSGSCTTSAASGSITFGRTFATAPTCLVVDATATSTVSMPVYTVSATAITLSTIITAHTLHWLCLGKIGST